MVAVVQPPSCSIDLFLALMSSSEFRQSPMSASKNHRAQFCSVLLRWVLPNSLSYTYAFIFFELFSITGCYFKRTQVCFQEMRSRRLFLLSSKTSVHYLKRLSFIWLQLISFNQSYWYRLLFLPGRFIYTEKMSISVVRQFVGQFEA